MVKATKARGNKRHEGPQHTNQEALDTMEYPNLSSIDGGLAQENYGNPLHSTALEGDINSPADGGMDGAEEGGGDKEKKSTGKKVGDGCVTEEGKNDGKKRTMKRKHVRISGAESQESGQSSPPKQRQRAAVVPSDDENASPKSSSKKSRNRKSSSDGSGNRKSSSDGRNPRKQRRTMTKTTSVSTDSESHNVDQQTERGRSPGKATELEVVLDAFLAFCHQYRESVESKAVRKAIDSFSSSVKEELAKKITIAKELRVLMRENAKVDLLIRKKRQRLLDCKDELITAEHEMESMRKEEAKLELRLADIRRGHSLLSGMSELTKQYLDHRSTHPQEKEEYGASSLPALLLETKYILGAENHLRQISNQLEERLKETVE